MAGTAVPVTSNSSSNLWLKGLLWGTEWSSGGARTVVATYVARDELISLRSTKTYGKDPWDQEEAALEAAMASFEAVCKLDFQATSSKSNADLIWASTDDTDANPPGTEYNPTLRDHQSLIEVNHEAYQSDNSDPNLLAVGGFDYVSFLHELGHAVGLAHPHDTGGHSLVFPGVTKMLGDLGVHQMNQGVHTIMTYNDGWQTAPQGPTPGMMYGYQAGPMALDIAALQHLYGANMSYKKGDNTYQLPEANQIGTFYSCLWDARGDDTIIGAGSRANSIDLRAATLQAAPGGGGFVSFAAGIHGGYTIANGAVIENAIGGAAEDSLRGNQVANILKGLDGSDILKGGGGADILRGGTGADELKGCRGRDKLTGGKGDDEFIFASIKETGDKITDFGGGKGNNDTFVVDASSFKGGLTKGGLSKDQFQTSSDHQALDGDVRFIFDTSNETVWFDRNGDRKGGLSLLADLQSNASVEHTDFLLV